MNHFRTILFLSVIAFLASSCEYYDVWVTDISTDIDIPEPPVVDPEPPSNCQFEFDESNLVVKLCSGADIEKLRSILNQYHEGLTIYFMQDINLADGNMLIDKNGTCMIDGWHSLPELYHSKILTPDDKQIRITLTAEKKCALSEALFSEIEYSTIKNLWLDYDLNSKGGSGSAAFLVNSRANRFENITFSGNVVHHFTPAPDTGYFNAVGGIVAYDFSFSDDPSSQFIATICQNATFDVHNMGYVGCVLGVADFDFELSTWPKTNHIKSMKCESEFGCSLGGLIGFFAYGTIKNSSNVVDEISGDGWIGGLLATSQHATIENVTNYVGSISDKDTSKLSSIGGIAGYMLNSKVHNIQNTVNDMNIKGISGRVGGVFGEISNAGDMENIVTRAKVTTKNIKYSSIAGFASQISSYSFIRFVNISSILETEDSYSHFNMFANEIGYDYFQYNDDELFEPLIEFSNIACTGTLDIITDNNPNVIGRSELGPDEIIVDNFWFEVPDTNLLSYDVGYPAFPHPGLYRKFSPYHSSTIVDALTSLNTKNTVDWKIDSDTIDNTKTQILTFEAVHPE